AKHDPVEAAVELRAGQAATVRTAKARQHLADAEASLIAEPLSIQAPLAAAGHIPVEGAVQAVPLRGAERAIGIDYGVVLRAKVALQHAHDVVTELAAIDHRLQVSRCVALSSRPAQHRGVRPGVDA